MGMDPTLRVTGWKVHGDERDALLERFPPRYADIVADHVTLAVGPDANALPGPVHAEIIGRADDGESLECLVVSIDGTVRRPDGSTFHITWSLDMARGRRPRDSNALLRERGWTALGEAIPVSLEPARLR